MEKNDVVEQQFAAIQSGQAEVVRGALGASFDEGVAKGVEQAGQDAPADTTPYDQAALDAAAEKARGEQKEVDDQILADAKADMQKAIDDLGIKLKEKDADALEEMIADKLSALAKELRERTVESAPVEQPAPIEPAPVEGQEPAPAPVEPGPEDSSQA